MTEKIRVLAKLLCSGPTLPERVLVTLLLKILACFSEFVYYK